MRQATATKPGRPPFSATVRTPCRGGGTGSHRRRIARRASAGARLNHADTASKADRDEIRLIKERVRRDARDHGAEISEEQLVADPVDMAMLGPGQTCPEPGAYSEPRGTVSRRWAVV